MKIVRGMPDSSFYQPAWESEPLSSKLRGHYPEEIDIWNTFPKPLEEISFVAKDEDVEGNDIGQCSTNKVAAFWEHLEGLQIERKNEVTRIFIQIHRKALASEKGFLEERGLTLDTAYRCAGLATHPNHRQKGVATQLVEHQIELCKNLRASSIFAETTNKISARIMEKCGFTLINQFPYPVLAEELDAPILKELDDSFSTWCMILKTESFPNAIE